MDKKLVVKRIDELMSEKRISAYKLKENAEISSTIYQWRKNAKRDATRTPSLKSIEKICEYLGVSLSYFFAFDRKEQADVKRVELSDELKKLDADEIEGIFNIVRMLAKNR